ncbi:MAG: hypothetical protein JSR64_15785 [Nitrospira sp.]|nr:hypothetical protein [Nitrospira sp.]
MALKASVGVGPEVVLGKSGAAVNTPADTSEDTLATINIPANAMGANGVLRIYTLWSFTSSANNKTLRIRFSGGAGTIYMNPVFTTSVGYSSLTMIMNRNATNSQVGFASAGTNGGLGSSSASANVTSSVDTTAATSLVITGQKASAGETLTLESYLVELIPG